MPKREGIIRAGNMKVKRTEQIWVRGTDNIHSFTHASKNIYNEANYIIRQELFKTGKWIRNYKLDKMLQGSENYKTLPADTSQQTLRALDRSWYSFFRANKEWKKHPEKFTGRPKPPGYKDKDGEHILIFTNNQCKIKDGILKFPKKMNMEVKTRLNGVNLREVRMIPQGIGYMIEIVYEKEFADLPTRKPERIMGIDIGERNIVTIGDNISKEGFAVKGGVLKSINQFFNKEDARLKSISDLQTKDRRFSSFRTRKLFMKRNRRIKDTMHALSKAIVQYAKLKNIDTIVIGHNNGWKQSVNMGKVNNQNFVQLPFNTLINQIKYKAEEIGINVKVQDESHTSKCSFLDNESVEHHDVYVGKRIKRGVFRSAKGVLIHADLNAVYNVIKKAVPEAFAEAFAKVNANGIEGIGLYPRSLSIPQFCGLITSKGG